jgi:RNA polymerase sigma-70 factor, ECF subfamily
MSQARAEGVRPDVSDDDPQPREFDRLFAAHSAKVRSLCHYVLGSRDAAEDAVSEVYVKARQAHGLYDADQPFAAWIMSVARHHCFDLLRRRRVEARLFTKDEINADTLPETTGPAPAPLARILARESRQALRAAIERLPRRYRLPLVLRYFEELSYDEIARALDVTRQDVATLLFRAKHRLRTALGTAAQTEVR